ncbi:heme exporter protein A [Arboricoccus pini]|uniref:Heme exporter protein A n=1 Tax=Arboricoccus pini TaxID=1963835 RepID=A0A212QQH1_9PROT|nr:heme ABC exporter ATP-binding protein CcmA [Arboricoccus pini]SNB61729.1 heme exporter protein A [Arboricoccus pini]
MPDRFEQGRLAIADLACSRGGRLLFEGLDLRLDAGDLLLVRGPNGSGKTSLLHLLAGMASPSAGNVLWNESPIAEDLPAHRARLHRLTLSDGLKGALTAGENLRYATRLLNGAGDVGAALEALDLAGLAMRPVRFLSTGQRRRVALARLTTVARPLWLLDEPETGLDQANRQRLTDLIAAQRREGGIVVLVSHADLDLDPTVSLDFEP